jgi:glycolate oxidase FAD binding subunit
VPASASATRPGAAADAVDGQVPATVARPGSVEDTVDVLRECAAEGRSVLPHGNRTKLDWAAPAGAVDVALDLRGLDRVVDHAAGDLVVVAEAGVRLADLQQQLARSGQMLALDPCEPGATLGGIVSANASGPRRLRYGTARDLLIGITVVLPDGTRAVAGGRVVKNVAGYDLGKLFIGAHGSLGAVVTTTWRLHPLPRALATVTVELDRAVDAASCARLLSHSPLTPTAVELSARTGAGASLLVLFESIPESVAAQAEAAVALLGGGAITTELPADFGERPVDPDALGVRIAHPPKALPVVLAALPAGTEVRASACSGITYAAITGSAVAALDRLRAALGPVGGNAVVVAAPVDLRGQVDHWGPVGDSLPLMRRVKDEYDPQHRFAAGRFVGGI